MNEPLNLLALDGGGIRGVSMLLILDEIMKRVQYDKGLASQPRPCEYFHLIGGTSTGGLIALMLGRLRMTTRDALQTYNQITEAVFCKANRKPSFKDGAFKATTLEKQVQELVSAKELGEYILRENGEADSAKTFVCAVPAANMAHPRLFRSYAVRENAGTNCKIWEAARATTAAPTFFKRITIVDDGGAQEDFLDGGLRFNNPTQLVLNEAMTIFGGTSKLGCLISIGTGHPGTIGLSQPDAFQKVLPTEIVGVLKRIATNCEQAAHELAGRFRQSPDRYFRFSVSYGVGTVSLEEWKKMDEVQVHTKAYMEEVEVSRSIDKVVEILCRASKVRRPEPSLQSICLVLPESATESISRPSMKYQPLSSSHFTGREDFLSVLEEFFTDQGPGQHLRREFLLYGMGGAGKTQIALKFAEKYRQRYEHVFWIDASNRDTVEHSYKTIALKIGRITDQKFSLENALRELELYHGRWLLLFDGADNLEDISGVFPPGIYNDILYTSRNRMLKRLPRSQMWCVLEMSKHDASELLLKSAHLDTSLKSHKEKASSIVTKLGCLALAIDQAGAYIASGECHIDDFSDTFDAHRQHLLQNDAYRGASRNDRAVYATWDLSYAAIVRQADSVVDRTLHQGPKAALWILQVFPFFHNEGIMEDIFRYAAENSKNQSEADCEPDDRYSSALICVRPDGRWENRSFRQGVQTLLSFSLIEQESSPRQFSMHRLVHLWAYDRLSSIEKDCFGNQARDILTKSIVWKFETNDYAFRRDLLPHVAATFHRQTLSSSGRQEGEGLEDFALVFSEAGRWKEAEELDVQVMETMTRVLGKEHLDTVSSMANLASTYAEQGRWKEAKELDIQVIEMRKKLLGEEHPSTLDSIANLASIYEKEGRWKEAEELDIQIMETRKKLLGKEHPSTLNSMAELATVYWKQGRWVKAKQLDIRVMETRKKILGEEHPSSLASAHNLASSLWKCGRLEEAEEKFLDVIETEKRVLGCEHPETLRSMARLASVFTEQRRFEEAEKLYSIVTKVRKTVLGGSHPDTLEVAAATGLNYMKQGLWGKAEEIQVELMKSSEKVLGVKHPDTLANMDNLASTYRNQKRWREAGQLEVQVYETRKGMLGGEHPDADQQEPGHIDR